MEHLWFEGPNWGGHFEPHGYLTGSGLEVDEDWENHTFRAPWGRTRRTIVTELFSRPWFSGGHGGDEYGNCSVYFRCPLFGIVWFPPTGHFQRDVEMPNPGDHPWIDRVFYPEC